MVTSFNTDLRRAFVHHWPNYVAEAMGVSLFMIGSCCTAVLLHHPDSPVRQFLGESKLWRRTIQAVIMGLVLLVINHNPAGKKSGSLINPAITLSYRYSGKISTVDTVWYILFQCTSAVICGFIVYQLLEKWYSHPDVNYNLSAPRPETGGWPVAFLAEFIISSLLIFVSLLSLHSKKFRKLSSSFGVGLIMLYIIFEAPFSGMSTNPARSLGTAAGALDFHHYWIYVVAPCSAMLLTTLVFQRVWKPNRPLSSASEKSWFRVDETPPNFPIVAPD
ncbi:MIP/aquaporin family protein [Spirosoma oryzicola]|uniref:MIP/aquaporin family protein n=1 Tax=Spirosoma oryzicola TaxID=2898794 RepID=UPI001E5604AD|nr:aquaporin [Spirosoma oryzicola]UHG94778.1 aquaporin [Spirosoma oryzicola]